MSDACLPSRRHPTWRTAALLTFTAVACCAQDRIVSYKHCDEGDSGIRVLNSGGRELLRLCQVGWPDQARFVQLTGSKASSADVVDQDQSAAERQINDFLSAIHNAKQRDATTDSGLNPCNGQPRSGHLAIFPNMDASTGLVTVNGHDDRRPTRTPLSWTWGDDNTKQGWFPQSHVYANTKQNYVIQVIAHEDDGSTDCEWFETAFPQ